MLWTCFQEMSRNCQFMEAGKGAVVMQEKAEGTGPTGILGGMMESFRIGLWERLRHSRNRSEITEVQATLMV